MAVVSKIFHERMQRGTEIHHDDGFAETETEIQDYFNDNTILKNDVILMQMSMTTFGEDDHHLTVLLVYND